MLNECRMLQILNEDGLNTAAMAQVWRGYLQSDQVCICWVDFICGTSCIFNKFKLLCWFLCRSLVFMHALLMGWRTATFSLPGGCSDQADTLLLKKSFQQFFDLAQCWSTCWCNYSDADLIPLAPAHFNSERDWSRPLHLYNPFCCGPLRLPDAEPDGPEGGLAAAPNRVGDISLGQHILLLLLAVQFWIPEPVFLNFCFSLLLESS